MDKTAAERKRRSRAHQAGDHSLCIPGRCAAATPEVTPDVTPGERDEPPAEQRPQLGEAGSHLWREMTADGDLAPMAMVLLLEACRIADRLARLDAHLEGEQAEWLELDVAEDGSTATVIVDKALAEARQQATALKGLVAEIRQFAGKGKPRTSSTPEKGGGSLADLTSRIAARRGQSTG